MVGISLRVCDAAQRREHRAKDQRTELADCAGKET
jgi:hypothetical protein